MSKIDEAKKILREAGYFTGNFWSVEDVKSLAPHLSNDEAHGVLLKALTNPATVAQVWLAIEHELEPI